MKKLKNETFFQRLRKTSSSTEADLMKAATLTEKKAINSVRWPGRQQVLEHEVKGRKIQILLDAAHTPGLVLYDFIKFFILRIDENSFKLGSCEKGRRNAHFNEISERPGNQQSNGAYCKNHEA